MRAGAPFSCDMPVLRAGAPFSCDSSVLWATRNALLDVGLPVAQPPGSRAQIGPVKLSAMCFGVVALVALAACGDHAAATPDASDVDAPIDAPGAFVEATPSSTPTVLDVGGPVLTAPVVEPIFFATDDQTIVSETDDFLSQLSTSTYWSTIAADYGVGAITVDQAIISSDTPPTTDTALVSWLSGHFDGSNGWPAAPDPQTIYAVFLPSGVVLQTNFGTSCQAFGGYHDETMDGSGNSVVYALLPRCSGGMASLTSATSHELIEASTDPHVETNLAYYVVDDDHYVWSYTPGGEVGDMCEYLDTADQQLVGNYYAQRIWSNSAAAAGHDPCVPAPAQPFLGAYPVLAGSAQLPSILGGGSVTTPSVSVPVGTSKTIEVDLFTDQPSDDYLVNAYDVASQLEGSPAELSFAWEKEFGKNGDKLHLTITRQASGQFGGSEILLVTQDAATNTTVGLWWAFISN